MNTLLNYEYAKNYIPQFLRERNSRVLTIEKGDLISASLSIKGNIIARVQVAGCTCREEVINMLKAKAREYHGMATVVIRNITREWNCEEGCYLRRETHTPRTQGRLAFSISY